MEDALEEVTENLQVFGDENGSCSEYYSNQEDTPTKLALPEETQSELESEGTPPEKEKINEDNDDDDDKNQNKEDRVGDDKKEMKDVILKWRRRSKGKTRAKTVAKMMKS